MGSKRKAEAIDEELEDDVPSINIKVISQVLHSLWIFIQLLSFARFFFFLP